jgi:hypothetical protein
MGEVPLNTLNEPHEFKASALRILSRVDSTVQSKGWWYNREELTLTPDPVNSWITLPGDALKVESGVRSLRNLSRYRAKPYLVARGRRMYNTLTGSYEITEDVTVQIVRQVPFDDLPQVVQDYITAWTVLRFQSLYDSDTRKREELAQEAARTRVEVVSEDVRQSRVNLIDINPRLQRIKSVTRSVRYNTGY